MPAKTTIARMKESALKKMEHQNANAQEDITEIIVNRKVRNYVIT